MSEAAWDAMCREAVRQSGPYVRRRPENGEIRQSSGVVVLVVVRMT